jgi:hypothetical protein
MSNVINFPRPAQESQQEPQQQDGDGGDGGDIVIRIVIDWPETSEDPEPEPEPKSGRASAFLWGALIGWWLGG